MDGTSDKGFSRFHRFLSRGAWSGLTGSRILLGLLLKAFVPDGQAVLGSPATPIILQKRILMTLEKLPEMRKDVARIRKHLGLNDEVG